MKILYDTQIFDWQISGGISRYFSETLRRLDQSPDTEVLFKCRHSYNKYIQGTKWLSGKPILEKLPLKGKLRAVKYVNEKVNRRWSNDCLKKGIPNIFHPTYYDPYFLKYLNKKPLVLTVHDLTNEKFFDNRASTKKVLGWKRELINSANHIIAVSENTKKDIVDYYKIEPDKISTVYLAAEFTSINLPPVPPDSSIDKLPEEFILYVGSRAGYKNFNGFVSEIAPVLIKEGITLVIVGGGNLTAGELDLLTRNELGNNFLALSFISDALLKQLYKKALLFVFPSFYEGFGLPVLEAMQSGCPVLISNNSSLPEVGGAAAAYFDPFTEGALRNEIAELLSNSAKRVVMAKEGLERAKMFNWDHTAAGHINVYKRFL